MIFPEHRIKTLITIAWLAIVMASLISGCGNAVDQNVDEENNEGVKEIVLYSPDKDKKPLYKLFIPSEYGPYAYRGLASFKTVYSGMVAFSPEIKSRFYNEKGAWGPDRVNIFFNLSPEYPYSDREMKNRNDAGKFGLESNLRSANFKPGPTPETIKSPERVKTFQHPGPNRRNETYVITQSDGRISLIRCAYETICSATTTWAGKFAIKYQFMSNHFDNMVDLDQSVVELFDQFTPTLISDKE